MNKSILLLAALSLMNFACSTSGCKDCDSETAQAAKNVATATTETTAKDQDGMPMKKISMETKNTDAREVLKQMFTEAQVKYEFAPSVQKQVITTKFDNMAWREALNQVVASAGYDYAIENGTVKVKMAATKKATGKASKKTAK